MILIVSGEVSRYSSELDGMSAKINIIFSVFFSSGQREELHAWGTFFSQIDIIGPTFPQNVS